MTTLNNKEKIEVLEFAYNSIISRRYDTIWFAINNAIEELMLLEAEYCFLDNFFEEVKKQVFPEMNKRMFDDKLKVDERLVLLFPWALNKKTKDSMSCMQGFRLLQSFRLKFLRKEIEMLKAI